MEGKKKNNAKFSGHYVRQRTHNVRAHALRLDQYNCNEAANHCRRSARQSDILIESVCLEETNTKHYKLKTKQ